MTVLLLCRHVEEGNELQADALAEALAPSSPTALYTSPLPRAVYTAGAVAARLGLRSVVVDALREIDRGEVEGLSFDAYPRELRDALLATPGTVRFPRGESYSELQVRVCPALDGLVAAHPEEVVAVISHEGPIRAALARWLSIPSDASFRLAQRHGAVNIVEFTDGVPLVRLMNG